MAVEEVLNWLFSENYRTVLSGGILFDNALIDEIKFENIF